jgi:hypothetical protein
LFSIYFCRLDYIFLYGESELGCHTRVNIFSNIRVRFEMTLCMIIFWVLATNGWQLQEFGDFGDENYLPPFNLIPRPHCSGTRSCLDSCMAALYLYQNQVENWRNTIVTKCDQASFPLQCLLDGCFSTSFLKESMRTFWNIRVKSVIFVAELVVFCRKSNIPVLTGPTPLFLT